MTVQMIRPGRFLAPVPDPIRGTLLDAATVTSDFPSQDTVGLFETYSCVPTAAVATFPCPPTFLAAPVQAASSTATTGGTLPAGTYRAVITALNSRGETVKSNEISQVTTGSTSRITWNWGAVTGATGYQIYVTNGATGSETFLVTLGAVTTYNWTGTPAYSATNPPPPSTSTAVVPVTKTFGTASWQDAIKMAVYAGVKCKAVSFDASSAAANLDRVFSNKESVAVARQLMLQRFVDNASLNWDAAVDLTPAAGAVDPVVGVAILEGHAGWAYAGAPTLHVPRTIGSLLLNKYAAIEYDGNALRTELGSKVAADSGYEYNASGAAGNVGPTGAAPSAGELWLYASGEVTVAAGDPISKGGDLAVGLRVNESGDSNQVYLLHERPYIATVDCYTAAVRVKVQ